MLTRMGSRVVRVVLALPLLAGMGVSVRADDLFSDDPLRSAFGGVESSKPAEAPEGRQSAPSRVIGKDSLKSFVSSAGFEVQREDKGVLLISVKGEKRTFPIVIAFSADESQIWLAMPLRTLPEGSSPGAEMMGNLLDANRQFGPAFFTFDKKERRIELRRAVRNLDLDAEAFKREVGFLLQVAEKSESLWTAAAAQPSEEESPKQAETPRHVGRWIARLADGQSFELTFGADGSFTLVHNKADGNTDRSSGTYTLENGQLELKVNQNSVLKGRVTFGSNDTFVFVAGSGNGLRFERAAA